MLWSRAENGTPPGRRTWVLVIALFALTCITSDVDVSRGFSGLERCPTLSKGDVGVCVARAQRILNDQCGEHIEPDGVFGDATVAAVRRCQAASGVIADGQLGPRTMYVLARAAAGR